MPKKKEVKKKERSREVDIVTEDRVKRKKMAREKEKYQNPRNWLLLGEEDYAWDVLLALAIEYNTARIFNFKVTDFFIKNRTLAFSLLPLNGGAKPPFLFH